MPAANPLEREKLREIEGDSPRQQKMAVVFLAILAISVVALFFFQFKAKLNEPFAVEKKSGASEEEINKDLNLLDSDNDGISNYDEINIYQTSPYLPDSDSDGVSDKEEIEKGTNPNCPAGKKCVSGEEASNIASSSLVENLNDDLTGNSGATVDGEESISSSAEVTPAILRQIMLQNGSDTSTLDKISDEDIMSAYREAVQDQSSSQ